MMIAKQTAIDAIEAAIQAHKRKVLSYADLIETVHNQADVIERVGERTAFEISVKSHQCCLDKKDFMRE